MDININKLNAVGRCWELIFDRTSISVGNYELETLIQRAKKYHPALHFKISLKERHPGEFEDFQYSIQALSDEEIIQFLREIQSETLVSILRFFRGLYPFELEVEGMFLRCMSQRAAEMLREDLKKLGELSIDSAKDAFAEAIEALTKLDLAGDICWKPNILKVRDTTNYHLIFGQTKVLLTEIEANMLFDQLSKCFEG